MPAEADAVPWSGSASSLGVAVPAAVAFVPVSVLLEPVTVESMPAAAAFVPGPVPLPLEPVPVKSMSTVVELAPVQSVQTGNFQCCRK